MSDMTSAVAIETLRANYPDACYEQLREAVDAAIEALKAQDAAGDTISRQAAIRWVKTECNPYGKPTLDFESGKKVIEHLKQMPSAQADSKELSGTHKALDTVSRQAAIEAINKIFPADPMRDDYTQGITCGAALANIYVAQLPPAQPEERTEERTETHECDLISRQEAIDWEDSI